ncbi:hypothetical protein BACPLE_03723 [Phocaeicola plebeius DSM 17135]|uniref:Uncharacterized protein n=1 Tax=Phocaeicola plebeius (strain DSM 17135 / JCM 12973 / CCUG 54634 / M2) TaxID=484018 RepID=B5D3W8_PHOPM|nr:hypothetical protein BACPLE_03723 [Phocaeicola plebeius DSM 17135]
MCQVKVLPFLYSLLSVNKGLFFFCSDKGIKKGVPLNSNLC